MEECLIIGDFGAFPAMIESRWLVQKLRYAEFVCYLLDGFCWTLVQG